MHTNASKNQGPQSPAHHDSKKHRKLNRREFEKFRQARSEKSAQRSSELKFSTAPGSRITQSQRITLLRQYPRNATKKDAIRYPKRLPSYTSSASCSRVNSAVTRPPTAPRTIQWSGHPFDEVLGQSATRCYRSAWAPSSDKYANGHRVLSA